MGAALSAGGVMQVIQDRFTLTGTLLDDGEERHTKRQQVVLTQLHKSLGKPPRRIWRQRCTAATSRNQQAAHPGKLTPAIRATKAAPRRPIVYRRP